MVFIASSIVAPLAFIKISSVGSQVTGLFNIMHMSFNGLSLVLFYGLNLDLKHFVILNLELKDLVHHHMHDDSSIDRFASDLARWLQSPQINGIAVEF